MLDLLIRDATVCDGTGNPWYRADIGVKGDRIAALGVVSDKARKTIRARGQIVCPGFVDVHTHTDGIAECPSAANMLRQGITTVISGNCGSSALPVKALLDKVAASRPAINFATLVGHGTVRSRAMGGPMQRRPTRAELKQMCRLTERAMRDGAVGMSTGLFYVPGAYAKLDEIVGVSKVVSAHGGVYASHKRSAGGKLFEALKEAATIGKKTGIPVEISHLKVLHKKGRTRKDRVAEALAAIARYREQGVDMTCDLHPYTATCTSLSAVAIPPWVSKGGMLKAHLRTRAVRRRIRSAVASNIAWIGGPEKIAIASFKADPSLNGGTLAGAARARKQDPVEAAMDLVVEGSPTCLFHALRQDDVGEIVCSPYAMIATDGGIVSTRKGVVHPRNYGTFPRVLREYVRESGRMSWEEAIRKMTYLPARKFGILDRGLVALGMKADLVMLDPKTVAERATFDDPHAFPVGIKCVVVNGSVAWNGRTISKSRSGRVIRKA